MTRIEIVTPLTEGRLTFRKGDEDAFMATGPSHANLHRLASMGVIKIAVRGQAPEATVKRAPRKRKAK